MSMARGVTATTVPCSPTIDRRQRGNNLGHGKGGAFGPLQHLGGHGDPSKAGGVKDKSHRIRGRAGFSTTGAGKGGLFGSYAYMPDGGPDTWRDAQRREARRRPLHARKPHSQRHVTKNGTFGAFPKHMADPYPDRPAKARSGAKGAIYTFTCHYHRSARPNTSGAGRVGGRTTAQMGEYTRKRVQAGQPMHTGHLSAR